MNVKIVEKSANEACTDSLQKISADPAIQRLDDSATTVTADHNSVIETFDDLTATIHENPIRACLCADHLSDPQNPSDVTQTVLEDLEQWWSVLTPSGSDDQEMNYDLYLKVISR